MDARTLALLAEAGFSSVTTAEFLGMAPEEETKAELKTRLTGLLRRSRKALGWTQAQLANRMKTTQQVVARAENGHRSVSLDLVIEALLITGISLRDISAAIMEGATNIEAREMARHRAASDLAAVSTESAFLGSLPAETMIQSVPSAVVVASNKPVKPRTGEKKVSIKRGQNGTKSLQRKSMMGIATPRVKEELIA